MVSLVVVLVVSFVVVLVVESSSWSVVSGSMMGIGKGWGPWGKSEVLRELGIHVTDADSFLEMVEQDLYC